MKLSNTKIRKEISWVDSSPAYDEAWKKYVPYSGPADTPFGEMLRCASRVIYRFYNDGDIAHIGYGEETCGDELQYLCDQNQYPSIKAIAKEIDALTDSISAYAGDSKTTEEYYDEENGEWSEYSETEYISPTEEDEQKYNDLLHKLNDELTGLCEQKLQEDNMTKSFNAMVKSQRMKKYLHSESFGLISDPYYDTFIDIHNEYRERVSDPNDAFNIGRYDYEYASANRDDPWHRLEAYDIEQALQGIKGDIHVEESDGGKEFKATVTYGDGDYFTLYIIWKRLGWYYGLNPFDTSEHTHPYNVIGREGVPNNSNCANMTAGDVLDYIRRIPEGFNALHPDL